MPKFKCLKAAFLAAVISGLVLSGGSANADLLFDNGATGAATSWCSSNNCNGGTSNWTFLDNFTLATDATLTSLEFVDDFRTNTANYQSTNWSIIAGDPFAAPIASGNAVGTLTLQSASNYQITLAGLNVPLAADMTYWLGTNNQLSSGETTAVSISGTATLPGGAAQNDGGGLQLTDRPDRAFRLYGTPVPEPHTLVLAGLGLLGNASFRRKRNM